MNTFSPYSLTKGSTESDTFYENLSAFTNRFLNQINARILLYINDFSSFMNEFQPEVKRTNDEYMVEMLMIGVLSEEYAGYALRRNSIAFALPEQLYKWRKKYPKAKKNIDTVRGYVNFYLLRRKRKNYSPVQNAEDFNRLVNWLSATGEYSEEVKRLKNWHAFMLSKNEGYVDVLLRIAADTAADFISESKKSLGAYVSGLENFRENAEVSYKFREDYFLATRRESEYYLNLFAAEILNRVLQKTYTAAKHKVLLLPTCMRTEPAAGCKAQTDGKELVCSSCSANCNIGKVAAEMKSENVRVYLIPHSSEFSRFLVKWKDSTDTALIGVACILNLITGGYEMQRLNIPSQCIFLDYCGCKKHWDEKGCATNLNVNQLKKTIKLQ